MSELADLIERHCRPGYIPSAIPRVTLSHADACTSGVPVIYHPLFCVLASGRKELLIGTEPLRYGPDHYLIASSDLPVRGTIVEAPCLGFTLTLDPAILSEIVLTMPEADPAPPPSRTLTVEPLDDTLRDAVLRLLRLLDRPADIPVMAPLLEREILYRLLLGPRGAMLRQLTLPQSRLSQIRRAIDLIRRDFEKPLRIHELARVAGMSVSSFHRHFRAITSVSPLQFQKHLRLHEARRRLISEAADAANVAFDVGYQSLSQFSREYRRLFGLPPTRDAARAREALRSAETRSSTVVSA